MMPSGPAKVTHRHNAESALSETAYVGPSTRFTFSFAGPPVTEDIERLLGCVVLAELLPRGYVHQAVNALWKAYQFAREDEELAAPTRQHQLSPAVAISDDDFDW